jgi:flagellar biosynthesis protein FlhA
MQALRSILGRNSDLALVIGVVLILLILFAPIPAPLLDLLLIVNFALALTILLLTFYVTRPVDFSTFPSLLLVATLFRLALNIAATRLILSEAQAGQVIAAIGAFVVQGNFVIGLIVFFILVVVQYVVVTNGAQRVSEVAARFVLDAMPGQQMSIDADLNMGFIDQDEAKKRRKTLEKEAAFYGAMDGASKFVKGDAIAGIVILLINIVGGLAIGVAQMGMNWTQALQTFTLLTIGDGIVTQVPALIVSTATGIIVTRSAADRELGPEVLRQLALFPKVQMLVLVALIGLLLLPGMPKWPIFLLGALLVAGFFLLRRRGRSAQESDAALAEGKAVNDPAGDQTAPPPVEVLLGTGLSEAWKASQDVLGERVATFRRQYAADMGYTMPAVVFRDATRLAVSDYEIDLFGDRLGTGTLLADRTLAIHASTTADKLPGVATRDPAFGLPAVWIEAAHVEQARVAGYTLVDPVTVFITHLAEVLKANVAQLLTRTEASRMLEAVRTRQPGLIEEVVPNVLSISDIQRVLQNLLAEGVPIRNLDLIVEVLADAGRHQKDPAALTEIVRQRLGLAICQGLRGSHEALSVLTIEPSLEANIAQSLKASDGATPFVLEPSLAEQFLRRLLALAESMMRNNQSPVLLCGPEVRRHLKTFTRRALPRLAVLSVSEVPHTVDLRSSGVVSVNNPLDARGA